MSHRWTLLRSALLLLSMVGPGCKSPSPEEDLESEGEKLRITMTRQRELGTLLLDWVVDQAGGATVPNRSDTQSISQPAENLEPNFAPEMWRLPPFVLDRGRAATEIELRELVRPTGRRTQMMVDRAFPAEDAWGRPMEVYVNTDEPLGSQVIVIRSAGANGRNEGPDYVIGPFSPSKDADDIIWADGYFVRWPGPQEFIAAEQGDASAQLLISGMYQRGDVLPKNDRASFDWAMKAAQQGLAAAQLAVSRMLFSGTGIAADDHEALRWLRLAAAQGDPDATFELGRRYVSPVLSEGRSAIPLGHCEVGSTMLTKAAEDGHVRAQEQLALLLDSASRRSEFGSLLFFPECLETIPADDVLAFRWTVRAAEAGSPIAHWMVGRGYLEGKGIPQDHYQAYVHFSIAAALGQFNASKDRDEIAALLSTDQLSRAQVESRKRFDAIQHE